RLPTYRDHPRNLLTLLGRYVPVHRYEIVTDLCPPSICPEGPSGSLRTALRDTATVYGHLALPARLRARLPSIEHAWGNFGDDFGTGEAGLAPEDPAAAEGGEGEP